MKAVDLETECEPAGVVMAQAGSDSGRRDDEATESVSDAGQSGGGRGDEGAVTVAYATGDARQVVIGGANSGTVDASVHYHLEKPREPITSSLPAAPRTFIGREEDLRRVLEDAAREPVVLIDGMAGVGKTTLAVRAAHDLADRFPDGRYFVSLHTHTVDQPPVDLSNVLASLLIMLGRDARHVPDTVEERLDLWRGRMAEKKALLVLDDVANVEQVRLLRPSGPDCLTLVTSRHRLPMDLKPLPLRVLDPGPAADLFVALAGRDREVEEERRVAVRIAELCGGLPLAIGLVGSRIAHHPRWTPAEIEELADELAEETDRLAVLDNADDPVVRAAFQLSYRFLPARRQALFRRLGLHPGTELEVRAVAVLGEMSRTQARRELEALFACHLIDETEPGRYRLHDLLREYARGLVAQDAEAGKAGALSRLLDFYQHTAAAANRRIGVSIWFIRPGAAEPVSEVTPRFGDEVAAMNWLRRERANLMACLTHVTGRDSQRTVSFARTVAVVTLMDGPYSTAVPLLRRAVAAAATIGEQVAEADAVVALGELHLLTDDYAEAAELACRALDLYRAVDDRSGFAAAMMVLAAVYQRTGDSEQAEIAYRQALAVHEEGLLAGGQAAAILDGLGSLHRLCGRYDQALDCHQRALELHREVGTVHGRAVSLGALGALHQMRGEYELATDLFEQTFALFQTVGNRLGQATVRMALGTESSRRGDQERAVREYATAAAVYRDLGNRQGEANALICLANQGVASGDLEQGDRLRRASALFRQIGDRAGEATAAVTLGNLHRYAGEYDEAVELTRRALTCYSELGYPYGEAGALTVLGRLLLLAGDFRAADEAARRSGEIYFELGDPTGQAYASTVRGDVCREVGERTAAQGFYDRALASARQAGDRSAEASVLESLARLERKTGE